MSLTQELIQKNTLQYLEENKNEELTSLVDGLRPKEIIHLMGHLKREDQIKLLTMLSPEDAAEVIEEIPETQAVDIIEDLTEGAAAAILNEMESDEQADIIKELDQEDATAILDKMDPAEAADVRLLMRYESDTAGGYMRTEYFVFPESMTVDEVTGYLQTNAEKYADYPLKYIFLTSPLGHLNGILHMHDLLLARGNKALKELLKTEVLFVNHTASLDELISFFNQNDWYGVPVVDDQQMLLGVVLRKDILEAESDRLTFEHLETQGIVGGEELRTMPVFLRARRRLSWLSINILLNIIAASVIAINQDILSSVIALAVFLPIISDMSGCSGNQAVAVSMRELSIGTVEPGEVLRVWWQEISVGLINGVILGLLIGAAAWLWKGNVFLGLVVGGALAMNTLVAVSIGGTVPLLLKGMNIDPALASGPILTTITDMFGFFLALTFASIMLTQLGGL